MWANSISESVFERTKKLSVDFLCPRTSYGFFESFRGGEVSAILLLMTYNQTKQPSAIKNCNNFFY